MAAADDTQRLLLDMEANLKAWEKSLTSAQRVTSRRLSNIEKQFAKTSGNVAREAGRMGSDVNRALATIGVGFAVREVTQYADEWNNAANKLRAAGTASGDLGRRQDDLIKLAIRTRSEYGATVSLYAKILRNSEALKTNELEVARAVEIVNKSFKAGGADVTEQTAAILQLGQALGSGVLQGDELRSIKENAPLLAQAIADEFKTTIGGLKKLGEEGKLTSERVFAAILKGGAAIDAQFAKTTPTIQDSFTRLQTEAVRFLGNLDDTIQATEKLALFIGYLADNIDTLADVAVVASTAVGGVLAGQAIVKLIAGAGRAAVSLGLTRAAISSMGLAAASGAAGMNVLRGAMAFLGGPWGVVITAISVAVAFLTVELLKTAEASKEVKAQTDSVKAATDAYVDSATALIGKSKEERVEALKNAAAKKETARQAIAAARANLVQAQSILAILQAENARTVSRGVDAEGGGGQLVAMGKAEARAKANVDALAASIKDGNKALQDAQAVIDAAGKVGGGGGGGDPKKKTGKTAAELAAQRELLAVRAKLEAAQAGADLDKIRALEDQLDLLDRTKAYDDAGLTAAQAKAQALADQTAILEARDAAQAREAARRGKEIEIELYKADLMEADVRRLEAKLELEDRIVAYQEIGYDLATATATATREQVALDAARARERARFVVESAKDHELTIAQLNNDRERVRILEREIAIRERARELEASGGLSKDAARAQATTERRAEEVATLKGQFRVAFRDGFKAAFDGDLAGFLKDKIADFSGKVLEKNLDFAADALFDQLTKAFPKLFDFTAAVTSAETGATLMGTAITTSGTSAATEMGAAIVTAGETAAQAMAAAITAASGGGGGDAGSVLKTALSAVFGVGKLGETKSGGLDNYAGSRASGGMIRAGGRYMLNDREPVLPTAPAAVLTQAAVSGLAALAGAVKGGRMGGGGDVNIKVENALGVPAQATTTRSADGVKLRLDPMADQALDAAGRSGKLQRAARLTPPLRKRG